MKQILEYLRTRKTEGQFPSKGWRKIREILTSSGHLQQTLAIVQTSKPSTKDVFIYSIDVFLINENSKADRSIRFYMIYSGIWPKMQSTLFSLVSTLYGERKRNRLQSGQHSLQTLESVVSPAEGKGQPVWLNEWIDCCNGQLQCQVIQMTLSFCTFSFQNFLYMAIDMSFCYEIEVNGRWPNLLVYFGNFKKQRLLISFQISLESTSQYLSNFFFKQRILSSFFIATANRHILVRPNGIESVSNRISQVLNVKGSQLYQVCCFKAL